MSSDRLVLGARLQAPKALGTATGILASCAAVREVRDCKYSSAVVGLARLADLVQDSVGLCDPRWVAWAVWEGWVWVWVWVWVWEWAADSRLGVCPP